MHHHYSMVMLIKYGSNTCSYICHIFNLLYFAVEFIVFISLFNGVTLIFLCIINWIKSLIHGSDTSMISSSYCSLDTLLNSFMNQICNLDSKIKLTPGIKQIGMPLFLDVLTVIKIHHDMGQNVYRKAVANQSTNSQNAQAAVSLHSFNI